MLSIESLSATATGISSFAKNVGNVHYSVWITWRDVVREVYQDTHDSGEIDSTINRGKALSRSHKRETDFLTFRKQNDTIDGVQFEALCILYQKLDADREDFVPDSFDASGFAKYLGLRHGDSISEEANALSDLWMKNHKESSFRTYVRVKAGVFPLVLDLVLRWLVLYFFMAGGFSALGGEESTIFFLSQFAIIPILVGLICLYRDRHIVAKTQKLLAGFAAQNIRVETSKTAWHYLLLFVLVLQGMFIIRFLEPASDPVIVVLFGIALGSYLLILFRNFSKQVPNYKDIIAQIEEKKRRTLQYDISAEQNDEEIVSLEVSLKSSNETMNAYVIEAALFGALAFSGFLTLVVSGSFLAGHIDRFSEGLMALFGALITFDFSSIAPNLNGILSPNGLVVIICYESLFCSIFFLSVIASRLRFGMLSDKIDHALQVAKSLNAKEEAVIMSSAHDNTEAKAITERIKQILKTGYGLQDKLAPITEYMKFFRTLGIVSFFAIIITGGLFISQGLAFVLLVVSLLSLVYFRLGGVYDRLRQLGMAFQEFYFRVKKYVNYSSWIFIGLALLLKSFRIPLANLVMLVGLLQLLFHAFLSLAVPVHITWLEKSKDDVYGSQSRFPKILENALKLGLALFYVGYLNKAMHWPGGTFFVVMGFMAMIFYFIFARKTTGGPRWISHLFSAAMATGLTALLFKTNHWTGSTPVYYLSLGLLSVSTVFAIIHYRSIRPVISRGIYIVTISVVLFFFPFSRWALTHMSLSYSQYEIESEIGKFEQDFYLPITDGGLADAAKPEDIAELRARLDAFTRKFAYGEGTTPNAGHLNLEAWTAFEQSDNQMVLKEALIWSEKAIELEEDWGFLDTYANLLHKLNRDAEALPAAERAYALGEDWSTQELLKEIRADLALQDQDSLK